MTTFLRHLLRNLTSDGARARSNLRLAVAPSTARPARPVSSRVSPAGGPTPSCDQRQAVA